VIRTLRLQEVLGSAVRTGQAAWRYPSK